TAAENKRRMVSYRVRKGDTFLGIADRFSVDAEDLRKWNHMAANKVRRGMVLRVYTLDSTSERGAQARGKSHAKSTAKSRARPARPSAVAQTRTSSATRD
ncbi:MAG: LysM peptidoglycan-binding domain-containing protein, partial [Candidatus Acidiferrum sp.]